MSPSIAQPGALGTDPQPGTPEHDVAVQQLREAIMRVAKLRDLEARLPLRIHDAELDVHRHAAALGLPSATGQPLPTTIAHLLEHARPRPTTPDPPPADTTGTLPAKRRRASRGVSQRLVWEHLTEPRTVAYLKGQLPGMTDGRIAAALQDLRARGHVLKGEGWGATWRRAPGWEDRPPPTAPALTREPPTEEPDP